MAISKNWWWMLISPTHAGLRETRDRENAASTAEDLLINQQGENDAIGRELQIANDQLIREREEARIRQFTDIGIKVVGGALIITGIAIAINKLKQ